MNDAYDSRLDRIEAAISELKREREQDQSLSRQLANASKKFVEKPTVESAKVFLNELDSSTKATRTASAQAFWTTVTVTVVTIMDDDQADDPEDDD